MKCCVAKPIGMICSSVMSISEVKTKYLSEMLPSLTPSTTVSKSSSVSISYGADSVPSPTRSETSAAYTFAHTPNAIIIMNNIIVAKHMHDFFTPLDNKMRFSSFVFTTQPPQCCLYYLKMHFYIFHYTISKTLNTYILFKPSSPDRASQRLHSKSPRSRLLSRSR